MLLRIFSGDVFLPHELQASMYLCTLPEPQLPCFVWRIRLTSGIFLLAANNMIEEIS